MRLLPLLLLATVSWAIDWPWSDSSSSSNSSSITSSSSSSSISSSSIDLEDGLAYAPRATACPLTSIVREALGISLKELLYVANRQEQTKVELIDFLTNVADLSDFDAEGFLTNATRNISIGLAFSGGGYRAMLCGAGEILALDNRVTNLTTLGLGGLLQSATYIAGLSGGSWLVGSLLFNDFVPTTELAGPNSDVWDLENLIFNPSGINIFETINYYDQIDDAIDAKEDAGYPVTITDVWGRALSFQFLNSSDFFNGGENVTWTDIQLFDSFKNYLVPFPFVVADGRAPGTYIINSNSTVFEFSPYELGSWDASVNAFADLRYLGTNLNNGSHNGLCVSNFDNAGFVMGTLSSLFNAILLTVQNMTDLNSAVKSVLESVLGSLLTSEVDIAQYAPNPFFETTFGNLTSILTNQTLSLVDGGEDLQNVPFYPLIQQSREVDVIFAFDNSADTDYNWPNGTAIKATFDRQFHPQGYGTPFPYVPSVDQFVAQGLNTRPVFFGCDATNLTSLAAYHGNTMETTDIPLVVYIPNSFYLFEANTSTFTMSYSEEEMNSLIQNGFAVASHGNSLTWAKCAGCAIIRREQERQGIEQSSECKSCFANYCWDGKEDATIVLTSTATSSRNDGASLVTGFHKSLTMIFLAIVSVL